MLNESGKGSTFFDKVKRGSGASKINKLKKIRNFLGGTMTKTNYFNISKLPAKLIKNHLTINPENANKQENWGNPLLGRKQLNCLMEFLINDCLSNISEEADAAKGLTITWGNVNI